MRFTIFFETLVSFLLFFITEDASSIRILAVEFLGSKSHVFTYLPLLEELSKRGHEVTLVSPLEGFAKEGIREITTMSMDSLGKDLNINVYEMKEQNVDMNPFKLLREVIPQYCRELYDREDIRALMDKSFDLIIFQPLFNECGLGFIHKVMQKGKTSLVLFTPTSAPNMIVKYTGGHHPPSFIPNILTGFDDDMTFFERMKNFGAEVALYCVFSYYYLPVMEGVYRDKLGSDLPSVKEILGKASIILSNGHFSINRPTPNLPDVIDVGGIHSRPPNPLPKDFDNFIEGSGEEGFILFSFGTGARGDDMPPKKRQIFLSVFAKLKQRVIWKYESESMKENLPGNVMLKKWLPQQDLLGHPKIKMFITHCGLGGIEESIFHGVPLLGIPLFGDQPLNAKEAENRGFLVKLDWNDLTEETLQNSINAILKDPSYNHNVQKLSQLFKDQIDKPLERAIWWIEYVLRYDGAPKLQSPARNLNFMEYHSLDVITAYISIFALALYVPTKIIKFMFSCILSKRTQSVGHKKKLS